MVEKHKIIRNVIPSTVDHWPLTIDHVAQLTPLPSKGRGGVTSDKTERNKVVLVVQVVLIIQGFFF